MLRNIKLLLSTTHLRVFVVLLMVGTFSFACGFIEKENKNKTAVRQAGVPRSIVVLGSLSEEFSVLKPSEDTSQGDNWQYSGSFPISGSDKQNEFTCVAPSHILSDLDHSGFFVSCSMNSQVVYLDLKTLLPAFSVKLKEGSNSMGMAQTESGSLVTASWALDQLEIIDSSILNSLKQTGDHEGQLHSTPKLPKHESAIGGFPSSVVATRDSIFVSLNNIGLGFQPISEGGQVVEVSTTDYTVQGVYDSGFSNSNSLVLSQKQNKKKIFVLNAGGFKLGGYAGDGGVSVFDIESKTVESVHPLSSPSALVELSEKQLLIADHSSEMLKVLNIEDGTSREVDLDMAAQSGCGEKSSPGAGGFISSLLKVDEEIFVLEFSRDCLIIVDASTLKVKKALRVADGPVGFTVL